MKPRIKAVETSEDAPEEGADPEAVAAPSTAFHGFAEKIGSRNLMVAIVTMPLFFIGALVLIIAVVGLPEEEAPTSVLDDSVGASPVTVAPAAPEAAAPETVLPAPAAAADPVPLIPPGGIALDGERLAVRIETPEGPVVYIYDLTTNEVVQTVSIARL